MHYTRSNCCGSASGNSQLLYIYLHLRENNGLQRQFADFEEIYLHENINFADDKIAIAQTWMGQEFSRHS